MYYVEKKDYDEEELIDLFTSVGLYKDCFTCTDRLVMSVQNSDLVIAAYNDDNKLIGLISTLTDTLHVIIVHLVVRPEYQGAGLGTELLKRMELEYPNHKFVLQTEEAVGFFKDRKYVVNSIGLIKNKIK